MSQKVIQDTKSAIQTMIQWENLNDKQITAQQYTGDLTTTKQMYNEYYQHLLQLKTQLNKLQKYWKQYDFSEISLKCINNVQNIIKDFMKLLSQDLIYDVSTQQSGLLTLQTFVKIAQTILLVNGIKFAESTDSSIKQQILNECSKFQAFKLESIEDIKEYLHILLKPIERRQTIENYNIYELKDQIISVLQIVEDTIAEIQQTSQQIEQAESRAEQIIIKGIKVQKLQKRLRNAQQQSVAILELSQVQDDEVEFTKQTIDEEIKQIQIKLDKAFQDFQSSCMVFDQLTMYQTYDILLNTERPEAYSVFQQINEIIQSE